MSLRTIHRAGPNLFAAIAFTLIATSAVAVDLPAAPAEVAWHPFPKGKRLDVEPKPIASDPTIKYDYEIVYVRAPRFRAGRDGKQRTTSWPEIGHPTTIDPGYDLMLLHPDGTEEMLVEAGKGSVTDLYVSFDAQWVYYAYHHDPAKGEWTAGADIYKVNVKSHKIVQLTHQEHTPNTGVADWSKDFHTPENGKTAIGHGVYNICPCPLPGGRVAFVSSRDSFRSPRGYPSYALQLHVMDDDGANVEKIGYLNVAGALHPVVLKDGRLIFSSLESQGLRGDIQWGIWGINPDGTNWGPVISAFLGGGASDAFHFQTQLSDGTLVVELYYNQNTAGFGAFFRMPPPPPGAYPRFLPADPKANPTPDRAFLLGGDIGGTRSRNFPFAPIGFESITRFTTGSDEQTFPSDPKDKTSPRVGKLTHPCAAPDNNLLGVWTPGAGPSGHGFKDGTPTNAGIYLIKGGNVIDEPGQMLRIKSDEAFNTHWPRPLVPYSRIYGISEPARITPLANDGKLNPALPEGTPFGLIGTSSLYKRESFPFGAVPKGSVTSTGQPYAAFGVESWHGVPNWTSQGADAGLYSNDDIHAIRILTMEPATEVVTGRFYDKAKERLRILGEIPVRKFDKDKNQPLDPDGNPDTSFIAKIPADTPFTFQTLDKNGMVLNMAQTWHQVRPGEVRNNCGGCHAHSQEPTLFEKTAAARADYKLFDLTRSTPLLTDKKHDQSQITWDEKSEAGLRYETSIKNVEYFRDVKPILQRSCIACHDHAMDQPAANVVLDTDQDLQGAKNFAERFGKEGGAISSSGIKAVKGRLAFMLDPRLVRDFQSRRSLLIWTIFGRRLDGFPTQPVKGLAEEHKRVLEMGDFKGGIMPPPEAVAGTYLGPDGKTVKVDPLTDEDRRTLIRWIDIGCPIDWAYDPAHPEKGGNGWMLDDQRPTLTLTYPHPGANKELSRIVIGAADAYSGLDEKTLSVTADVDLDDIPAGQELAAKFSPDTLGVWQWKLTKPSPTIPEATLTVRIKDKAGNTTRIARRFSVSAQTADGR